MRSSGRPRVLTVFLKAPRPGTVKTRLVPALGEEMAAELYRALAEEVVRRTAPAAGEYRRLFFFSPPEARAEMGAWFPGEALVAQEGEDLGARMANALLAAFAQGAKRAAVIGSDAPWLTRETVGAAFAALDDHDLVLGPAADGGYYLLALRRPQPELFTGIAWSSGSVLATTISRAAALGLRVRQLPVLADVDTLDDLRREWPRLLPLLGARPALRARIEPALRRRWSP